MIQTFSADGTDQSFDKWILPRGVECGEDLPNVHGVGGLKKRFSVFNPMHRQENVFSVVPRQNLE
jgi:hypothetical protein